VREREREYQSVGSGLKIQRIKKEGTRYITDRDMTKWTTGDDQVVVGYLMHIYNGDDGCIYVINIINKQHIIHTCPPNLSLSLSLLISSTVVGGRR
jgi:hypothetical protein